MNLICQCNVWIVRVELVRVELVLQKFYGAKS